MPTFHRLRANKRRCGRAIQCVVALLKLLHRRTWLEHLSSPHPRPSALAKRKRTCTTAPHSPSAIEIAKASSPSPTTECRICPHAEALLQQNKEDRLCLAKQRIYSLFEKLFRHGAINFIRRTDDRYDKRHRHQSSYFQRHGQTQENHEGQRRPKSRCHSYFDNGLQTNRRHEKDR